MVELLYYLLVLHGTMVEMGQVYILLLYPDVIVIYCTVFLGRVRG